MGPGPCFHYISHGVITPRSDCDKKKKKSFRDICATADSKFALYTSAERQKLNLAQ